jgi:protein gp37
MGTNSKIEWCDHTFNPWEGCSKVSPGCAHCYAETRNARFGGGTAPNWGPGAPRRRTSAQNWKQPLKWNREAAPGTRPRVFCASLADWLDDEVPALWLSDLLNLIRVCRNLDWLLLTKRPQNCGPRLEAVAKEGGIGAQIASEWLAGRPMGNIWVGTTVEDQKRADERILMLVDIPARRRFLSCEPLLGPVDLQYAAFNGADSLTSIAGIHWVICGGESGPGARPMHPDWARSLRDQCEAAGIPFFFKQWGEWLPMDQIGDRSHARNHTTNGDCELMAVGKAAAGRFLDDVRHSAFPR